MLCFAPRFRWLYYVVLAIAVTMTGSLAVAGSSSPDDRGKPSDRKKWPQASLQAQAVAEVAHDTVKITLATEISDESQDAVGQTLNRTLKAAMSRALENAGDVKVTSGNYRIWPMNDKDGKISNWRGRGEIQLESTDFQAASELAALLSDDLVVTSLNFFVSPQTRAVEEEKLLAQAAQAFRKRAQALAGALGYSEYRLRQVDLGGSGAQYETAPRGVMQAAAMYKSADSLPLEGGTDMISVSIHGSVFLVDAQK